MAKLDELRKLEKVALMNQQAATKAYANAKAWMDAATRTYMEAQQAVIDELEELVADAKGSR